ncbi:hypothetical protein EJ04DRAFT_52620 [Polyplosphaeria fusca]|uniref:Uncharacterized protein n=1 Tax=Polyplosphaeria fusca TaxID=682080 RepID=A0A9P4R831_9PLEO|nr:hypothetical protein EJ04DRAFT_52620 [Polyplosphaeria fusca]
MRRRARVQAFESCRQAHLSGSGKQFKLQHPLVPRQPRPSTGRFSPSRAGMAAAKHLQGSLTHVSTTWRHRPPPYLESDGTAIYTWGERRTWCGRSDCACGCCMGHEGTQEKTRRSPGRSNRRRTPCLYIWNTCLTGRGACCSSPRGVCVEASAGGASAVAHCRSWLAGAAAFGVSGSWTGSRLDAAAGSWSMQTRHGGCLSKSNCSQASSRLCRALEAPGLV